jgi:hypothetical protein
MMSGHSRPARNGSSSPPSPASDSRLNAVSCPSSTHCTPVGNISVNGGTFAEQWNGSTNKWTIQHTVSPTGGSFLFGVSCSSPTACTTVG